jgi:hypothetical protein
MSQRLVFLHVLQKSLADMKVLFFAPQFFDYEQEIKRELERQGCQVDWFDDRPNSSPLIKALIRVKPEFIASYSDRYFTRIIEKTKLTKYDVVFVIKGEAMSIEVLAILKEKQIQARFLYYTFDSLKNYKNSFQKLTFFEKTYSFDRSDTSRHSDIIYLPLFYTQSYETLNDGNEKNDVLMLASIHSDRYVVAHRILDRLKKQSSLKLSIYCYFFYQSKWAFLLMKLFNNQFKKIPYKSVSWKSLTQKQTTNLVKSSRILIDIHHPEQSGLTMRTIESLGAHKKLITTNDDVKNHDFYCAENICVVDRNNPEISLNFITTPYKPIDPTIYKKYSLKSWVQEILHPN